MNHSEKRSSRLALPLLSRLQNLQRRLLVFLGVVTALLFLGGWAFPLMPDAAWLGFLWVGLKTYLVIAVIFWLRGTFPRLRVDQLMSFAWKALIPLSFANIVMTAVYLFYGWPGWSLTIVSSAVTAGMGYLVYRQITQPARQTAEELLARARAFHRKEQGRPELGQTEATSAR